MGADSSAVTALNRFGLGPRPGDIARIGSDPKAALLQELSRPDAAMVPADKLVSSQQAMLQQALYQMELQKARLLTKADASKPDASKADASKNMPANGMMSEMAPETPAMEPAMPEARVPAPAGSIYEREIAARLSFLAAQPIGFTERLVMFWSNHFCISLKDSRLRALSGGYEREAIRPHITGKFVDMLVAVEQHPAMLIYLDNNTSIGRNSVDGIRNKRRGLNENLARETLELHTLGVDGGYTQADVTTLARIITGWTVIPPTDDAINGGRFAFSPARHEPGDQTMLGQTFKEGGVEQGVAALQYLARHPATARHIARKFATYFVADQPPASLVAKLEKSFIDTNGDLGELARTLVLAPESWEAPVVKLRTPQEFVFAAVRLTGQPDGARDAMRQLSALGQPMWQPNSPAGFGAQTEDWLSPTGLNARLDVADQIARSARKLDIAETVSAAFGGNVSEDTKRTIRRAETREQALALMLMSPEFQRR